MDKREIEKLFSFYSYIQRRTDDLRLRKLITRMPKMRTRVDAPDNVCLYLRPIKMMAYQDALSYNIFVQIHVFYMDHLPKINLKSTAILMLAVLLIGEQFKNILPKNISALDTLCRSCDIFHSSSIVDRVVVDELQDLLDVVVHDVIGKREEDGPLFLLEGK